MKNRVDFLNFLNKMSYGMIISITIMFSIILLNIGNLGQLYFYEVMPFYTIDSSNFKIFLKDNNENYASYETEYDNKNQTIIGSDNIKYKEAPKTDKTEVVNDGTLTEQEMKNASNLGLTNEEIANMRDLEYLQSNYYIVSSQTQMTEEYFNIDKMLSQDMTIQTNGAEPKVLITHTHGGEMYSDSKDISEGVFGVGDELARVLDQKYGITSIHDKSRYDLPDTMGAYERMEPSVEQILAENPSIEIVIDIHRDGVPADVHLVTDVNGKPTAQVMFFNGLSQGYDENGNFGPITSLPNPNLDANLAFSLQLKLMADQMYPGFSKKIYLNAYRYSLNMKPKSTLIEVGAQTNTKEEAYNAAEPLADIIAAVVLAE